MMSCCHGGPGSITYNRRLQSAEQVISILRDKGHFDLPPLPLVPYVLSMATTVVYRSVIDCQRSPQEALPNICDCCDALDDLSQLWTSAKGIAKLARWLSKHITSPSSSSRLLQKHNDNDKLDSSSFNSSSVQPLGITNALLKSASEGAQATVQDHQALWSTSVEATNDVLLGVELGQGFNDLALDVFADMETAGFFDYLNSNYGESESSQSLD